MAGVLVPGTAARAAVAAALRERGATVTEGPDIADVPSVAGAEAAGGFDAYVQLPASFAIEGDTAIRRVQRVELLGLVSVET